MREVGPEASGIIALSWVYVAATLSSRRANAKRRRARLRKPPKTKTPARIMRQAGVAVEALLRARRELSGEILGLALRCRCQGVGNRERPGWRHVYRTPSSQVGDASRVGCPPGRVKGLIGNLKAAGFAAISLALSFGECQSRSIW